jgi:hypothetical protein
MDKRLTLRMQLATAAKFESVTHAEMATIHEAIAERLVTWTELDAMSDEQVDAAIKADLQMQQWLDDLDELESELENE